MPIRHRGKLTKKGPSGRAEVPTKVPKYALGVGTALGLAIALIALEARKRRQP